MANTLHYHTVSWLNSSVTLLVSKAPLNRTVKNGCFWVDPPFRFRVQKANFAFLFSGGLKKKADPPINFPLLTISVTWDTVCQDMCFSKQAKLSKMDLLLPTETQRQTFPQGMCFSLPSGILPLSAASSSATALEDHLLLYVTYIMIIIVVHDHFLCL